MVERSRYFKISAFFILLLAHVSSFGQGTWERINIPTKQYLKSVTFSDSLYGWAAGDSGTIIHTSDGGTSWAFQDSHGYNEISDIFFLNRNLGWASSLNYTTPPFGTTLLKTTNGGTDWIASTYPGEDIFITCILYRDSLNGWMGGRPHALVKTKNGGADWTQADIDTSILSFFPVLSIQFFNDKYGYASGGMFDIAGVIWRTSNGGGKWYAMDAAEAPADEVHGLYIIDSLNVIGAGGDPDFGFGVGMSRTSDGGIHWNYEELDIQGNAYDIDFRNRNEAWAPLGPKRKLIYSLDAGTTWKPVITPDSTAIFDVVFPDSLHGFAVGQQGAMIKYKPRVIPSVDQVSMFAQEFTLGQNYPNPFSQHTKIKYHVPPAGLYNKLKSGNPGGRLILRVYNILGNEAATRTVDDISPGEHLLELEAESLPGGIYFYQLYLIVDGQSVPVVPARKFILLRTPSKG